MSPDSAETRLRNLERDMTTAQEQIRNHTDDLRLYAPLIAEQAAMRATVSHMANDLSALARQNTEMRQAQEKVASELERRLEKESEERRAGQEARVKESRQNRTLLWVAAIGLLGSFLSSLALVIAAVM
jgi:DNA repair exonuclease SbcCD ATPase subunit